MMANFKKIANNAKKINSMKNDAKSAANNLNEGNDLSAYKDLGRLGWKALPASVKAWIGSAGVFLLKAIAIAIIIPILFGSFWVLLTDPKSLAEEPQLEMYEKYLEKSNKIENECFTKAYEYTAEKIINKLSKDESENMFKKYSINEDAENIIFKSPDSVKTYFGNAVTQTEDVVEKGYYPQYYLIATDDSLSDKQRILSFRQEESTGYKKNYTTNSDSMTWDDTTSFIYFENSGGDKGVGKTNFINSRKYVYNVKYSNARVQNNGYSSALFETLHKQVYEYYMHKNGEKAKSEIDNATKKIKEYLNNRDYDNAIKEYNKLAEKYYNEDDIYKTEYFDNDTKTAFDNCKTGLEKIIIPITDKTKKVKDDSSKLLEKMLELSRQNKHKEVIDEYNSFKNRISAFTVTSEAQKSVDSLYAYAVKSYAEISDKRIERPEKVKFKEIAKEYEKLYEIKDGADLITLKEEKREENLYKMFQNKDFYENILSFSIQCGKSDTEGASINYNYHDDPNVTDIDKELAKNLANTDLLNCTTMTIHINVDVCDTEQLLKIVGYIDDDNKLHPIVDSNGDIDKDLEFWIFSNNNISKAMDGYVYDIGESNAGVEEDIAGPVGSMLETTTKKSWMSPLNIGKGGSLASRRTSFFGESRVVNGQYQEGHNGTDYAAPLGTKVASATDGVVVYAGWGRSGTGYWSEYGNCVAVWYEPEKCVVVYAHLSAVFVRAGDTVKQGQHIGNVGSTGFSTGPHLHFEVRACTNGYSTYKGGYKLIDGHALLTGENSTAYSLINAVGLSGNVVEIASIQDFVTSAMDASKATIEMVTDAGYPISNVYWQYKIRVYNVLYSQFSPEPTYYDFFTDTDNIVRTDEGNLDISGPYNDGTGNSTAYWIVHTKPNTAIYMPLACNLSDLNDAEFAGGLTTDYDGVVADGMHSPNIQNLYSIKDNSAEPKKFSLVSTTETTGKASTSDYMTYYGYNFEQKSTGYVYKLYNLQCYELDANGDPKELHTVSSEKYKDSDTFYYDADTSKYQTSDAYSGAKTVYEYIDKEKDKNSHSITKPVIVGATYNSKYLKEDYGTEDTFVFGIDLDKAASINLATQIEGKDIKDASNIDIYDWFDLDYVDYKTYNSNSGATWPLVGCYEAKCNTSSDINYGKVVYVHSTDNETESDYIISEKKVEGKTVNYKISGNNFKVNPKIKSGTVLTQDINFGTVGYGNFNIQTGAWNKSKQTFTKGSFASGKNIKRSMNISFNSDVFTFEGNKGARAKVVAMFGGTVVEKSEDSITVYSKEMDLYYTYSGCKMDCLYDVGYEVSIGNKIAWVYRNDVFEGDKNTKTFNVQVYKYDTTKRKVQSDNEDNIRSEYVGILQSKSDNTLVFRNQTGVVYKYYGDFNLSLDVSKRVVGRDYINVNEVIGRVSNNNVDKTISLEISSPNSITYHNPLDYFKDLKTVQSKNGRIYIQVQDQTGKWVSAKNILLHKGEKKNIKVNTQPADNGYKISSNNTKCVKISNNKIIAVKPGKAKITATLDSNGLKFVTNVFVTKDATAISIYAGEDSGNILNASNTVYEIKTNSNAKNNKNSDLNVVLDAKSTYSEVNWSIESKTKLGNDSKNYLSIDKLTGELKCTDNGMSKDDYATVKVTAINEKSDSSKSSKNKTATLSIRVVKPVTDICKTKNAMNDITFYTSKKNKFITEKIKGDRIYISDFVKTLPIDATYRNEYSFSSDNENIKFKKAGSKTYAYVTGGESTSGKIYVSLNKQGQKFADKSVKEKRLEFSFEIKGNDLKLSSKNIAVVYNEPVDIKDCIFINGKNYRSMSDKEKAVYNDVVWGVTTGKDYCELNKSGIFTLTDKSTDDITITALFGKNGCDGKVTVTAYNYSMCLQDISNKTYYQNEEKQVSVGVNKELFVRFWNMKNSYGPSKFNKEYSLNGDNDYAHIYLADTTVASLQFPINPTTLSDYPLGIKGLKKGKTRLICVFKIPDKEITKYKLNNANVKYVFEVSVK